MSAELITVRPNCRRCGAALTIEEMHYYDDGNGTATCNDCEGRWMAEVEAWKRGERSDFPDPSK